MTRNFHDNARELIAQGELLSDAQQVWLRSHLEECEACRDYAEAAGRALRAMRSQPMAAGSALVQTTQMRVRQRALELQRQRERLWVICVCCFAVTLSTALTTAAMWRGFAWMGQQARLSGPVWEIGLLALGLMPAMVAAILMLARGTYLADSIGSLQE
jgi:predicted anti-sigma-YlaC factor YlaD